MTISQIRNLFVSGLLLTITVIPAEAKPSISITADVPETIRALVESINTIYKMAEKTSDKLYKARLERIRVHVATLASQELIIATKLESLISQSINSRASDDEALDINDKIVEAKITFENIVKELDKSSRMDGLGSKLIGNLQCLGTDSILFGYDINACYQPAKPSKRTNVPVGLRDGLLFAAGRLDTENSKATTIVSAIKNEAHHLRELARALEKEMPK